jgi:hypothetical protein
MNIFGSEIRRFQKIDGASCSSYCILHTVVIFPMCNSYQYLSKRPIFQRPGKPVALDSQMTSKDALEKTLFLYPFCSVQTRARHRNFPPNAKVLAALLLEHLVTVIIYDTATIYSANIYCFTNFLYRSSNGR